MKRAMKLKRKGFLIVSVFLGIMMIAGLTLAFLTSTSNTKQNTFTLGPNISIRLAEPAFDGLDYVGGIVTEATALSLGVHQAENFVPGRVIPKDPSVKNTGSQNAVWVAVKLHYTVGEPDPATPADTWTSLSDFANINFNTSDWEMKTGSDYTVFYFKTSVLPSGVTSNLFNDVTIKTDAAYVALHPFVINIKAYAVQAEELTYIQAQNELDALILASPL